MNPSAELAPDTLPNDIALKIASSLQVPDVCSLGSCSRFWRELCGSDCLWESLCKDRWPRLASDQDQGQSSAPPLTQNSDSTSREWKGFYMNKHNEMALKAAVVHDYIERCLAFESIEVGHYLKAIEDLCSMQFEFKDIQIFFLKPDLHVLSNLVGLHYSIVWLGEPVEYVMEALSSCKISEREVCVQWWKLGRWFYGFRLRDELHSRNVSLGDLASTKDEEVLGVLHRGAIHEVLRVQISAAKPIRMPWSCEIACSQHN